MEIQEIIIFGLIWGGLMMFFLTPFDSKTQDLQTMTYTQAFKKKLVQILIHKKAILALVLLIVTIIYFWQFYSSIQIYQHVHGEDGSTLVNPEEHAIYYITGACLYSVLIYLFLAFRKTYKELPNRV